MSMIPHFFKEENKRKKNQESVMKTKEGDKEAPRTESELSFTAALLFPFYREDN